MYCGHTCSLVAVDVQATAAAFEKLFTQPELRRQRGEAGRARAQALYDWKPIIGQYEDLWDKLNEIRAAQSKDLKPLAHPWPARMDPFHAFASYPTQALTPQTVLARVDADLQTSIQRISAYRQLAMVNFAQFVLPTEAETLAVLQSSTVQGCSAEDLIAAIEPERKPYVLRALAWLLKLGVLKVVR